MGIKKVRMTEEQAAVVDAVRSGEELVVVQAYAGSGKTHTLTEVARAAVAEGKTVLYLVFNRSMRKEAKHKFARAGLPEVTVLTAHGLAWRHVAGRLKERLVKYPYQLYSAVRREVAWVKHCPGAEAALVAGLVKFSHSSDSVPSTDHVPLRYRMLFMRCGIDRGEVEKTLMQLWREITDPGSNFPLLHDFYLKNFYLSGAELTYDLILYDEAQDANAPMWLTVLRQPAQKVFVGDAYQAIYGWRGAVNALERLEGLRLYLSRTFRFGHDVADLANKILALLGERVLMRADSAVDSRVRVGSPSGGGRIAVLQRTNADAVEVIRQLWSAGYRAVKFVRGKEFVEALTDVVSLKLGKPLRQGSPLHGFTWRHLRRAVEQDPTGYSDLTTLVRLVDRDPAPGVLLQGLERAVETDFSRADAVVSTVHQAKGLEWDQVWVRGGFQLTDIEGKLNRSELMLLYVALTRARRVLFLPPDLFATISSLEESAFSRRAA